LDGFYGEHKNHIEAVHALKWMIANMQKIEIIDVETSGVELGKEVLEVGIRNLFTGVEYHKYFFPRFSAIDCRAIDFHGLSRRGLFTLGASTISSKDIQNIREKITDSYVACANVEFYLSALNNSVLVAGESRLLYPRGVIDLGWLFSDFYNMSKSFKWSGSALNDIETMVNMLQDMTELANLDWNISYDKYKHDKVKYLRMY
jgi:hypothetical protein